MSLIITLAHQKGGVGKSTLSLQLMSIFQESGYSTLIVDTDEQGSIRRLKENFSGEWETLNLLTKEEIGDYYSLTNRSEDVIIIDTPPYLSKELEEIFDITNFVLVPTKASPMDALAIESTVDLVRKSQQTNSALKAGIVINMNRPGTDFGKQIREILDRYEIPTLQTEVGDRVSYKRSLILGPNVSVEENEKANAEINGLTDEILQILNN